MGTVHNFRAAVLRQAGYILFFHSVKAAFFKERDANVQCLTCSYFGHEACKNNYHTKLVIYLITVLCSVLQDMMT